MPKTDVLDSRAVWRARSEFCSDDDPTGRCPERIDITGRARVLIHGPYLELAPGDWRAIVLLDLCKDAARRRFRVTFGTDGAFTQMVIKGVVPGRQEILLDFTFDQACNAVVGVALTNAAFHGELKFLGAWFQPRGLTLA